MIRKLVSEKMKSGDLSDIEVFNSNGDDNPTVDEQEIANLVLKYERGEMGVSDVGAKIVGLVRESDA